MKQTKIIEELKADDYKLTKTMEQHDFLIDQIKSQNKNRAEHVKLVEAKQTKWVAITDNLMKDTAQKLTEMEKSIN